MSVRTGLDRKALRQSKGSKRLTEKKIDYELTSLNWCLNKMKDES